MSKLSTLGLEAAALEGSVVSETVATSPDVLELQIQDSIPRLHLGVKE